MPPRPITVILRVFPRSKPRTGRPPDPRSPAWPVEHDVLSVLSRHRMEDAVTCLRNIDVTLR